MLPSPRNFVQLFDSPAILSDASTDAFRPKHAARYSHEVTGSKEDSDTLASNTHQVLATSSCRQWTVGLELLLPWPTGLKSV